MKIRQSIFILLATAIGYLPTLRSQSLTLDAGMDVTDNGSRQVALHYTYPIADAFSITGRLGYVWNVWANSGSLLYQEIDEALFDNMVNSPNIDILSSHKWVSSNFSLIGTISLSNFKIDVGGGLGSLRFVNNKSEISLYSASDLDFYQKLGEYERNLESQIYPLLVSRASYLFSLGDRISIGPYASLEFHVHDGENVGVTGIKGDLGSISDIPAVVNYNTAPTSFISPRALYLLGVSMVYDLK